MASTYVKHSVTAYATGGDATAVHSYGSAGTYFHTGGDVTATAVSPTSAKYGAATGVLSVTTSGYTNTVKVDGNVTVNAVYAATGIDVENGYGLASVGGNVTVTSSAGDAIGVEMNHIGAGPTGANYYIHLGANIAGAVTVDSLTGNATGVSINGVTAPLGDIVDPTLYAYVGGTVTVHANLTATGVEVSGYGDIAVKAGAVSAISQTGTATAITVSSAGAPYDAGYSVGDGAISVHVADGVYADGVTGAYGVIASGGYTTVDVGGSVEALASGNASKAVGIDTTGGNPGSSSIDVGTFVYVVGHDAYGIKAGATGVSTIVVGDGVSAYAGYAAGNRGNAVGISSLSGYDTSISVGRYVIAYGGLTATGVTATAGGNLSIKVGTFVDASAITGDATGISAVASYNSYISAGSVLARSTDGAALGIGSQSGTYSYYSSNFTGVIKVTGDVSAFGGTSAEGINAVGEAMDIHVGGNVTAVTAIGEADGIVSKSYGNSTISVGGNLTATGTTYARGVRTQTYGNYSSTVTVGGATTVTAGEATGIYVEGGGAGNIAVGDVTATGNTGRGFGVLDFTAYATVSAGNVKATGKTGATGIGLYVDQTGTGVNTISAGSVSATTYSGYAIGVRAAANGVDIELSGDVTALANATSGGATAIGVKSHTYGNYTNRVYVGGNVKAVGYNASTGIDAQGNAAVQVVVKGGVTAGSYADPGAATGVKVTGYGAAYTASVHVYGGVTALSGNYAAQGVELTSAGAGNIVVGGAITAGSKNSAAYGVVAQTAAGDLYISTGDISATSGDTHTAFGIEAQAHGQLAIYAGNVTVHGAGSAYGVQAQTYGAGHDIYIDVSSVSAVGAIAPAFGIEANATGSIDIRSSGEVSASGEGYAVAIRAVATGNVTTDVGYVHAVGVPGAATGVYAASTSTGYLNVTTGAVHVSASTTAYGIELVGGNRLSAAYVNGDMTVTGETATGIRSTGGVVAVGDVYGNVSVTSTAGNATGLYLDGQSHSYANVTGNLTVKAAGGDALGIYARGDGAVTVYAGAVYVASTTGNATGIDAPSFSQHTTIYTTGDVTAHANATSGYAIGVETSSLGNVLVTLGGNVTATGAYASGVAVSEGQHISVDIAGGVYATAYSGGAEGVNVSFAATGQLSATVTAGNIVVYAPGSALGVEINGGGLGNAAIVNTDNITVTSLHGYADGVIAVAAGLSGNATVDVDGAVKVYGSSGAAGIEAHGLQIASANVSGSVYVTATDGDALGVSVGGNHSLQGYVAGNLIVHASEYALGANAVGVGNASRGDITVKGDEGVYSTGGAAVGVTVTTALGASAEVYGNLTVYSKTGGATGIELTASGNVGPGDSTFARIGGDVSVHGYGYSTGVITHGRLGSYVDVGGNLTVVSTDNSAIGVSELGSSDGVKISGNVSVIAKDGDATGIGAGIAPGTGGPGTGGFGIHVGGYVYASATGTAFGVDAYTLDGNASAVANVTIGGGVTAKGGAAYGVDVTDGRVDITVTDDIYAYATAGPAIGVVAKATTVGVTEADVVVYGDVTSVSKTGVAGGVSETANSGIAAVTVYGDVEAKGYSYTYGVKATGGNSRVYVHGNVSAMSKTGYGVGVYAHGSAYNIFKGQTGVDVTGNVYASGVEARGVWVVASGSTPFASGGVLVGGNATAIAGAGPATAVLVTAYGSADGNIGGYLRASSTGGAATGMSLIAGTGNATAYVGRYVDVYSGGFGDATGVVVSGNAVSSTVKGGVNVYAYDGNAVGLKNTGGPSSTVSVGGYLHVISDYGSAEGVVSHITGIGDNTISVGDAVVVRAYDDATGVDATGGNVSVTLGGDVRVLSGYGAAMGVHVTGDAYTYVKGNTSVVGATDATGFSTTSTGYAGVKTGGYVYTHAGTGNATGFYVSGAGVKVGVGGYVTAIAANAGSAMGVDAVSTGYAYVTTGSIAVKSTSGNATGVEMTTGSSFTGNVTADGDVIVQGGAASTAISDNSGGAANVYVHGNVIAGSLASTGASEGIYAQSGTGYSATVHVTGGVYVTSGNSSATGVDVQSGYASHVNVDGNMVVNAATNGDGIEVTSAGYASVGVGGTLTAYGKTEATGINVNSGGNFSVGAGDISADSLGDATGVAIHAGGAGNLTAGNISVMAGGDAVGATVTANFTNGSTHVHLGSVYVESSGAGAVGVYVSGQTVGGYAGDLTVHGNTGATGLEVSGYSVALAIAYGNVTVTSSHGAATGVEASDFRGVASAYVGGNLTVAGYGAATGVSVVANYGPATVGTGNVTVTSATGTATGVYIDQESHDYRALAETGVVYVKGAGDAVGFDVSGEGLAVVYIGNRYYPADLYVRSTGARAIGAEVVSGGYEPAFFTAHGNVTVEGATGATGVTITSDGYANAEIYGNLSVVTAAGSAQGVTVTAYHGSATVEIYGGADVTGVTYAGGVRVASNIDATAAIYGDLDVHASGGNATGAIVTPGDGYGGGIYVGGDVTVAGSNASTGLELSGEGTGGVIVEGNVTVGGNASTGGSIGVEVFAANAGLPSDASATVYGDVTVTGNTSASGVIVDGDGYAAEGRVYGNLTVHANSGTAVGMSVTGDALAYVKGNVSVIDGAGDASGVTLGSVDYGKIQVGGNVYVSGGGNATGATLTAQGDGNISIGGYVDVKAAGNAYGVIGNSTGGNFVANVGGYVSVVSTGGGLAEGVGITAGGNTAVTLGGYVAALSHKGDAEGVVISGVGGGNLTVAGQVYASGGADGLGISEINTGGGALAITVDGDVTAIGGTGHAVALYASNAGGGATTVDVHGNVTAKGGTYSYGVNAKSDGAIDVSVTGAVTAMAGSGDAMGAYAASTGVGDAVGVYAASVSATSTGGNATGVDVTGEAVVTVGVTGDVVADAKGGVGTGVEVTANFGYVTVGGNVFVEGDKGATGVRVGVNQYASVYVGGSVIVSSIGGAPAPMPLASMSGAVTPATR